MEAEIGRRTLEVRSCLNQEAVPIQRVICACEVASVQGKALGILLSVKLPVEFEDRILDRTEVDAERQSFQLPSIALGKSQRAVVCVRIHPFPANDGRER